MNEYVPLEEDETAFRARVRRIIRENKDILDALE